MYVCTYNTRWWQIFLEGECKMKVGLMQLFITSIIVLNNCSLYPFHFHLITCAQWSVDYEIWGYFAFKLNVLGCKFSACIIMFLQFSLFSGVAGILAVSGEVRHSTRSRFGTAPSVGLLLLDKCARVHITLGTLWYHCFSRIQLCTSSCSKDFRWTSIQVSISLPCININFLDVCTYIKNFVNSGTFWRLTCLYLKSELRS